jgi:hypothetical protein
LNQPFTGVNPRKPPTPHITSWRFGFCFA